MRRSGNSSRGVIRAVKRNSEIARAGDARRRDKKIAREASISELVKLVEELQERPATSDCIDRLLNFDLSGIKERGKEIWERQ